ncbi:MAG: sel1 repeat family protein [Alphaproteobacteria bacterium]|nr:sel1 repeat family protein [Alphaproteobacteria bacterium]MDA8005558.1 sel1 repeat family protein [Alphaproteobacteria bacterium]MDA8013456.1 sel1 repeat family protein [Alphaproteobacteria bacterium]
MKSPTLIIAFALALSLLSSGAAWSADYEKGLDALLKGDYETALQEWEPLAEQGDAKAQYSLGNLYYFGNGVPRNYEMALKWFRPAAEQGLARAQYNLGTLYLPYQGEFCSIFDGPRFDCIDVPIHSHSVTAFPFISRADDPQNHERSYEMALKWYRLAAEQGYANAQFVLGQMYAIGKGVPQDSETAMRWYHLAAEQGHAQALHHLGDMMPGNFSRRLEWHALAEEHGFIEECR